MSETPGDPTQPGNGGIDYSKRPASSDQGQPAAQPPSYGTPSGPSYADPGTGYGAPGQAYGYGQGYAAPGNAPAYPPPAAYGGYGAPAPSQLAPSEERTWAMLGHLGGILFGFLAPLVVLLIQGPKSPFVRRQAVESLNFQIALIIAYIVSFVLVFVIIGFVLIPVIWVGSLILM